jgi:L-fuconolactonase
VNPSQTQRPEQPEESDPQPHPQPDPQPGKIRLGSGLPRNPAWLSQQAPEPVLEPQIAIVDAHHHLWDRGGERYLLEAFCADLGGGHQVTETVFVECGAFYRDKGPAHFAPVGETETVNRLAESFEARAPHPFRPSAAIVGFADLTRADEVRAVLQSHLQAAPGRFRGVRHAAGWDASPQIRNSHTHPPAALYAEPAFRAGFAHLATLGLSFDAWQYHPQLAEVTALARAFPEVQIILNHCGGPLGVGPYAGRHDEVFARWSAELRTLSGCPNVSVKLGGLGMRIGPVDLHQRPKPADSATLAQAWRPWIHTCIETFGADRCMFESNFPVDAMTTGYTVLWNAFKRLATGASAAEKALLFGETARRIYRL